MTIVENLESTKLSAKKSASQANLSDEVLVRKWNDITERIKARTPDCPFGDGEKGTWQRMLGFQGASEYKCPNGHRFSVLGDLVRKIED